MVIETELAREVAAALAGLYVSERSRFVAMRGDNHYIPKAKGRTMFLAESNIVKHIQQEYAVSVFGAREGSRFLCFDVDEGGLDAVKELCEAIERAGIDRSDIHISASGKKGHHIELFFDEIVAYSQITRFFYAVVSDTALDARKVECRPTNNTAIKLPLSIHPGTGKICWYLDQWSLREVEDYRYVFSIRPMRAAYFTTLANGMRNELPEIGKAVEQAWQEYANGKGLAINTNNLPALQQPGTRHSHTLRLAVALRCSGVPLEACQEMLLRWMANQDQTMYKSTPNEVYTDTYNIVQWTYKRARLSIKDANWVSISRADMQRVMTCGNKTKRKLYFLLLLNRCYWKPLRQEDFGSMVGVSERNVIKIIGRMTAAGELVQHLGGKKMTKSGCFCSQRSRYDIVRRMLTTAQEERWPSDLYYHSFRLPETPEEFSDVYYGAIHAMFRGLTLEKRLTAQEYAGYLRYVDSIPATPKTAEHTTTKRTTNRRQHHGRSETGNPKRRTRLEGMGLYQPERSAGGQATDPCPLQPGQHLPGAAGAAIPAGRDGNGGALRTGLSHLCGLGSAD